MIHAAAAQAPAITLGYGIPQRLRQGLRLVGQFLLLVGLYYTGTELVRVTGVPLPGNLVGMLLLLGLLKLGIIKLDHVQDAAALLLQHLNLFFIPLAVGLMAWGGVLGASGIGLGISLVGSAIVGVAVAGSIGQRLAVQRGTANAH